MSYTKTTWVDNHTPAINAENLNNIEDGIEANDNAITNINESITTINDSINDLKGTITNINESITTINDSINDLKGTILWTNPNPNDSFSTTTITLENNDCDMLLWLFKRSNSANFIVSTTSINGYGTVITNIVSSGDSIRRGCTYQGNNQYLIGDGIIGASSIDNQLLIPLYVIGYKTGLF